MGKWRILDGKVSEWSIFMFIAPKVVPPLVSIKDHVLMRGWFPIFRVVEVGRLVEISTLVKKALNRGS
jgi:hypothetical protein